MFEKLKALIAALRFSGQQDAAQCESETPSAVNTTLPREEDTQSWIKRDFREEPDPGTYELRGAWMAVEFVKEVRRLAGGRTGRINCDIVLPRWMWKARIWAEYNSWRFPGDQEMQENGVDVTRGGYDWEESTHTALVTVKEIEIGS